MAFWVILAQIIKAIITVKRVAETLSGIAEGNLIEGLIRSYLVGAIVDGLVKGGVPLDKLDFVAEAEGWADHVVGETKEVFDKYGVSVSRPDLMEEILRNRDRLLSGKAVGNGLPPTQNLARGADPIVLARGEFEREVADFQVNGAGLDFQLRRTYRSGAAVMGTLGFGWDHSYNLLLHEDNEFVLSRLTGALNEHRFVRHPRFDESDYAYFMPPDGVHDVVVEDGAGSFLLLRPQGVRYFYEQALQPREHRARRIEDRFGNFLDFSYAEDGLIERILVNSAARHVTFFHDDLGRLIELRDHAGRRVRYEYDDVGFLTGVAGPSMPGERLDRVERYEYSQVGRLRKLSTVTNFDDKILVENEYNDDTQSEYFGQVTRQTENRGEAHFFYQVVSEEHDPVEAALDRPVLVVLETWRSGHEISHWFNELGNEILMRDQFVEGCTVRAAVRRYRYNADGQVVAAIDPEGAVTQFLYGRDQALQISEGPAADSPIADIPLKDRMAFGNLLATVTRGARVRPEPVEMDSSFWTLHVPRAGARQGPEDIVTKFRYGRDHQLLISKSDPRWTQAADPLHVESARAGDSEFNPNDPRFIAHQSALTRFEYGPAPRFEPTWTRFPDRTRPSLLDGRAKVTEIAEGYTSYDARGRPTSRVDTRGFLWIDEYFDATAGPREGFTRRRLVPHSDVLFDQNALNMLEVSTGGGWRRLFSHWLSNGNIGDYVRVVIEGVRLDLQQSLESLAPGANVNVEVSVDGVILAPWNQTTDTNYLIEDLVPGAHVLQLRDVAGSPISIGRIGSHVSLEFDVDHLGRVICETDGRGNSTTYVLDSLGRRVETASGPTSNPSIVRSGYDPAGRLIYEEEEWRDDVGDQMPAGSVNRRFAYDQSGHLLRESEGAQNVARRRNRRFEYNVDDDLKLSVDARGTRTDYLFDALQRQIQVARATCSPDHTIFRTKYDLADHPISQRNARGAVQLNGIIAQDGGWHSGIDTRGRARIQTDPMGNVVIIDYNALDAPTVVRLFQKREDKQFELLSRRQTEYDEHGDVVRVSDAIFESPIGTANLITGPDVEFTVAVDAGLVQTATIERHLDSQGNVIAIRNPDGGIEHSSFDGQGRPLKSVEADGRVSAFVYDANGNATRVYRFDPIKNAATGETLRYEAFVDEYEFDEANRQTLRRDSYGNEWSQKYDSLGNIIKTLDPLGNSVRIEHNAFGQLTARIQERTETGVGGGPTVPPHIEQREYDDNGNLSFVRDYEGNPTVYEHDRLDRLTGIQHSAGLNAPKESRQFDGSGNLVRQVDRSGLIHVLTYDLSNRHLSTKVDASAMTSNDRISPESPTFVAFRYDAAGAVTVHENDFCLVEIQRDSRGLALKDAVSIRNIPNAPATSVLTRTYDLAGRRTQFTFPSGRQVDYTFDDLGRVTKVRGIHAPSDYPGVPAHRLEFEIVTVAYAGRRLAETHLGNGLIERRRYDGRGHLIEQRIASGDQTLVRMQRLHDAAGLVRKESTTTRAAARSRRFGFDSTYRLVDYRDGPVSWMSAEQIAPPSVPLDPRQVSSQSIIDGELGPLELQVGQHVYEYDARGNRLSTSEPGKVPFTSMPNGLNQYSAVAGTPWIFDTDGNLRSDGIYEFRYDHEKRLQGVVDSQSGALAASYFRDALGRAVAEVTDTGVTFRIFDGTVPVVEWRSGSRTEFTVGHSANTIIHAARAHREYWLTFDGQGSLRLLTDEKQDIVSVPTYRPFGASEFGELDKSPFMFAYGGMSRTQGIELYHSARRSYRPDLGRHLQRDPLGPVDDLNPYAYVSNNPVGFADSTGLGKGKVVGWIVKRTAGRLINTAAVFTEREAAKMFAKGADVLVKGGHQVAKRIARMAIPSDKLLHHVGHVLKNGKIGRSHFQNAKLGGKNSRHIFYGLIGGVILGDDAFAEGIDESAVELSAIYSNEAPGESKLGHAFTFTYHFGEDSWASYLDWINPGEFVAMGGDFGRWIDREIAKELLGIAVTIRHKGEPVSTYAFGLDGTLQSVSRWTDGQISSTVSGDEFLKNIEDPEQLQEVLHELEQVVNE